jgi:hypothetical protein
VSIRNIAILICIISFSLIFFVENSMAGICFCGKCFPRAFHDYTRLEKTSTFHKYSSGDNFKNCRLSNGESLKGAYLSKHALRVKSFRAFVNSDSRVYSLIKQSQDILRFFYFRVTVQPSPIYLKNLSFRC